MSSLTGVWLGQAATVIPSPPPVVQGDAPESEAVATHAQSAQSQPVRVEKPQQQPEQHKEPLPQPAVEAIKAAAEQIQSWLRDSGRSLEFRVDRASGRTVVSVRNPETGELIRQIPGEETLRIASALGTGAHALVDISA